jgi:hypothetical protein
MFNRPRILMSEADTSGGNGAVAPSVAVSPSESAAPVPTAPPAGVDVDAIAAKVRDSLFAELRRSGMFEKQKPAQPPAKGESPSANPQPDPLRLRALDRALAKNGLASRLSDSQYQRAEKAFMAEDPPDVDGWTRDYFDGFGMPTPSPVNAQPAPGPAQPTNARPASDRGSPPAPQVPLYEQKLRDLTEADRSALIKEKGLGWYRTKLAADLKGQPIKLR